jgi:quinoprotein glucose dehydrogenase
MRNVCVAVLVTSSAIAQPLPQKGDWPIYGRDAGGTRYSPLDQINTANVTKLQRAWTYHTGEKGRAWEVTPIVADGLMYLATPGQRIVALEPETGREVWKFDPHSNARELRGVSYWPGDAQTRPRVFFGTGDGRLIALDAKTGEAAKAFGDNGTLNLRAGITDKFPKAAYGVTSPPAIYRNVIIVGPSTQEGPSVGPPGDPRGFDAGTGKLLWRFHTVPQPGEPGADTWGPDGTKDRSGPSAWGLATVDTERGLVFLPIGNTADSFYGADRKGTNLYANSVIALDALTGKLRWYYQTVHHDIWDYDLAAPPALVEMKRDGQTIPAVAQLTKMGLLFILDRETGKPVFGAEERAMPHADTPGEVSWPTQPFPLKPPPLSRMSMTAADVTTRTPDAHKFCAEWFARLRHEGPYTPFGTTASLLFPGTMGGGNWGGVSIDPKLGYIFVNTSSLGGAGHMVQSPAGSPMPWRNEGGYQRFIDQDGYPCQQPPWGELVAINAEGDVAWRVPLGNYDAVEAAGLKNAGAANMGGSIATAGGVVFIGATTDAKFRAFESRTGKELWVTRLDATADAVPMTYLGRNGKQYVVIAAGGSNRFRMIAGTADQIADSVTAFALGDGAAPPSAPMQSTPTAPAARAEDRPLPEGSGKAVVVKVCTGCHGSSVFTSLRLSREGWSDALQEMIARGARATPSERRTVIDYLTKHYGR